MSWLANFRWLASWLNKIVVSQPNKSKSLQLFIQQTAQHRHRHSIYLNRCHRYYFWGLPSQLASWLNQTHTHTNARLPIGIDDISGKICAHNPNESHSFVVKVVPRFGASQRPSRATTVHQIKLTTTFGTNPIQFKSKSTQLNPMDYH